MIAYDPGKWGIRFVFSLKGSVFPKAVVWAIPSAVLTAVLSVWFRGRFQVDGAEMLWSSYTFVLGFLIVFRNNQAYSRFWEGAALIHQVRGEWFNACSSLFAFCTTVEQKRQGTEEFQHLLVRLMSMLHCGALQQIAEVEDNCFEIIDPFGIEEDCLHFLAGMSVPDRGVTLVQWIQRMIVEAEADGILQISPPILSRVYQELSRGIVNVHNVRKIKEVPFPYPYAQTLTVMLLIHWLATPIMASQAFGRWEWAAAFSFTVVAAFWSLLYISMEIEQPFGEDSNDLPVAEMQIDFNHSLSLLLIKEVQKPPEFVLHGGGIRFEKHDMNSFEHCTSESRASISPEAWSEAPPVFPSHAHVLQVGTQPELSPASLLQPEEHALHGASCAEELHAPRPPLPAEPDCEHAEYADQRKQRGSTRSTRSTRSSTFALP